MTNMPSSVSQLDQSISSLLAEPSPSVRWLSPSDMLIAWARKILETADLERRERQNLHDVCRVHRAATIDKSAFGVIARYAPRAPINAAIYGTQLIRVEIVGRGNYQLPPPHIANEIEERANHLGNVAQLRHTERRDRASLHDLTDSMGQQREASDLLAMSEAAAMRSRSSIMLASR